MESILIQTKRASTYHRRQQSVYGSEVFLKSSSHRACNEEIKASLERIMRLVLVNIRRLFDFDFHRANGTETA